MNVSRDGQHVDAVIDGVGLIKRFGEVRALDGLDVRVRRGDVHGFLGPNGSGKTTAIRAMLGQIRLGGGELSLFGMDHWRDATRIHRRLAYVPGDVTLWPGLTGGECIDLLGHLHGTANPRARDRLIEQFALDPTRKTRAYSKGNRQKVALIAALATDAELLILDEPTSGLDPLMEAEFQRCIRERVDQGATVLLSSHILAEVEALCDRVTILRHGRALTTATLHELRSATSTSIEATLPRPFPGLTTMRGVVDAHHHPASSGGVRMHLRVASDGVNNVVSALLAADAAALVVAPPTLDELFMQAYGVAPAGDEAGSG
jgi:ABC-2 type transport system ATP-binding protein